MSIRDTSGRVYKNATEWWTAVERLADSRFGPRASRFPHQDHISSDAPSGEAVPIGTGTASPVRAESFPDAHQSHHSSEASAASDPSAPPRTEGLR
jgi:hypothetical protein